MKLELRSVRIKNCGPIDDIKIDFFDASGKTLPVCVIGGANGSGKTTLLEIIFAWLHSLLWYTGKDYFDLKEAEYAQLDCQINNNENLSIYFGEPPVDAVIATEKLIRSRGGTLHEHGLNKMTAQLLKQQVSPTESQAAENKLPVIVYFPHNRSLEPVEGTQISKETIIPSSYRFETVRQFPGSLNSYLIWLDYAHPEKCREILGFLNRLDFDGKTFRIEKIDLDVIVKTKTGKEHKLHELSSGEQNLLIILIELRRRLTFGSIVLIDEVENSLHPAYQHRLAQGLLALQKEIPYQLIVTTHAPAFVEIFGEENTRLLTPF